MEKEIFVEWHEQWSQFFSDCNWYIFDIIKMEFEDDRSMGGVETTWMLLGLGFRVRWNFRETERSKEVGQSIKDIIDSLPPKNTE